MTNDLPASEGQARSAVEPLTSLSATGPTGFARTAWAHWKKIAHAVGVVQTRVLMVLFYFIAVVPIGLVMRFAGDPLHLKLPAGGNWTAHRQDEASLERARQQF